MGLFAAYKEYLLKGYTGQRTCCTEGTPPLTFVGTELLAHGMRAGSCPALLRVFFTDPRFSASHCCLSSNIPTRMHEQPNTSSDIPAPPLAPLLVDYDGTIATVDVTDELVRAASSNTTLA